MVSQRAAEEEEPGEMAWHSMRARHSMAWHKGRYAVLRCALLCYAVLARPALLRCVWSKESNVTVEMSPLPGA